MPRCPELRWVPGGFFSGGHYECTKCNQVMYMNDSKVKYTCDSRDGDEYRKCPIYQNGR